MMKDTVRELTFEEEALLYEKEARAEFAKENGNDDSAGVNNILRRGMRIIRKARALIGDKKPMTNGDRIRAMSDEELVKFFEKNVDCCGCMLYGDCTGPCPENWLNWLKQPAEADS